MNNVGQMLLTGRLALGLTQEELAERTGITQAALSRYEGGAREPDEQTIAALAEVLGVTPSLLERGGRLHGAIAAGAHMRRRRTARVGDWRRVEAQVMMMLAHCEKLLDVVHMRAQSEVPSFDCLDTEPRDAARTVRMRWRMPLGPVNGLTAWLEAAGIFVFERDLGPDVRVDGMSIMDDGVFVILVNSSSPTDRKRWTLAHELGHLVLHTLDVPPEAEVEREADAFAAEFLMPADEIGPELRRLRTSQLLDLKLEWGVSMAAIVERAHGLGSFDDGERRSFYKMMSARGMRRVEPGSDQLAPEVPELPAQIAHVMLDRSLSAEDIATIAGFSGMGTNDLFPAQAAWPERLRPVASLA